MKTLVLKNADETIRVEYKVDIMDGAENFTVMEIVGMSDAEVALGLDFQCLATNLQSFKTFATANNLALEEIDINPTIGSSILQKPRKLVLTVIDGSENPVEGALIKIGTVQVGITDENGESPIYLPDTEVTLTISADGFVTEDFTVGAGSIDVTGEVELITYPA
jgi:hypothetical protein